MSPQAVLKIKVQVFCGTQIAMGPGKADLLEAIGAHGSISAAAKAMGMSYRRAWQLVDVMNRCWQGPLVETVAGGSRDRGARVTSLGEMVLARYRQLHNGCARQLGVELEAGLAPLLLSSPRPSTD